MAWAWDCQVESILGSIATFLPFDFLWSVKLKYTWIHSWSKSPAKSGPVPDRDTAHSNDPL